MDNTVIKKEKGKGKKNKGRGKRERARQWEGGMKGGRKEKEKVRIREKKEILSINYLRTHVNV